MINNITSYVVSWMELVGLSKLVAAVDSVARSHDRKLISRCGNMIVYAAVDSVARSHDRKLISRCGNMIVYAAL